MDYSRRSFVGSALKAGFAAPFIAQTSFAVAGRDYSKRTVDLINESLVIDMLGLLTLDWPKQRAWFSDPASFTAEEAAKLQRSGIGVFHPAIEYATSSPRSFAASLFNDWRGFVREHPSCLTAILEAEDFEKAKQEKHVGILLGMQNSNHFTDVSDVGFFHNLGQRVSQLTYNSRNLLGTGCIDRKDEGLTAFGAAIVGEMNRVGMAIDVSHVGDVTTIETIRLSRTPVLITHSNCRALVPGHPRCKSDEVIKACAKAGGVMGITAIRSFVKAGGDATLEHALDHFDHVARLAGVEHIGLGSDNDLDGRDKGALRFDIHGLNHPLRVYDLTAGLIRRGYSDGAIRMILGGNFQRALASIWNSQKRSAGA